LEKQRKEALDHFQELIQKKNQLESNLYEKFVEILNEKKKKIQQLSEQVKLLQQQQAESGKQRKRTIEQVNEDVEEDVDDNEEQDQDEEIEEGERNGVKSKEKFANDNDHDENLECNQDELSFPKLTPSMSLLESLHQSNPLDYRPVIRRRHRPEQVTSTTVQTGTKPLNNPPMMNVKKPITSPMLNKGRGETPAKKTKLSNPNDSDFGVDDLFDLAD